jgi:hypothetical protein
MMETSGHGALKENYYLDDGAYLAVKVSVIACVCMCVARCVCMWLNVSVRCVHACLGVCAWLLDYICVCAYIYLHLCVCVCVCIRKYVDIAV